MGRKSHQLTEGHQALYKEVIKLKKNVINKVLYFEQAMNEAHTVKDYATSFYESLEYFELPSQLMTQRDELELAGLTEKPKKLTKYGMV